MHFDTDGRQATIHLILLHHTATRCNTLQHAATCRNTLQHTAAEETGNNSCDLAVSHCNTLQHAATRCNTLQQGRQATIYLILLHHTTTHCNTLQHTATRCNTLHQTATLEVARSLVSQGHARSLHSNLIYSALLNLIHLTSF